MTRFLVVLTAACTAAAPSDPVTGTGHVIYNVGGRLYRIAAEPGAAPEDLSAELPGGATDWGDTSADGAWLVYAGITRCVDTQCLMIAPTSNLSRAVEVQPGGRSVHPASRPAIAPDGNTIVYTALGSHALDLFATTRTGATWSAPIELTAGSNRIYNQVPRFSPDGATLAFDCGADAYSQTDTTICEVARDGSGFRILLDPWPAAGAPNERHHPAFAPDGSLVFEADADGERIWRLSPSGVTVVGDFENDNTPCALPDGRVASLYLGRAGAAGAHELKLMDPDGGEPLMLVTFASGDGIADVGLGCGG